MCNKSGGGGVVEGQGRKGRGEKERKQRQQLGGGGGEGKQDAACAGRSGTGSHWAPRAATAVQPHAAQPGGALANALSRGPARGHGHGRDPARGPLAGQDASAASWADPGPPAGCPGSESLGKWEGRAENDCLLPCLAARRPALAPRPCLASRKHLPPANIDTRSHAPLLRKGSLFASGWLPQLQTQLSLCRAPTWQHESTDVRTASTPPLAPAAAHPPGRMK